MKKNSGITLIALVITVIVMLILVAVTINMAINGGLFAQAGRATGDTKNAIKEEQELANGKIQIGDKVYNSIDDYLNEIESSEIKEIHNWTRTEDTFTCSHCNASFDMGDIVAYTPSTAKTSTTIELSKLGIEMDESEIEDAKEEGYLNQAGDLIVSQKETRWIVLGIEDQNKNGTYETLLVTTEKAIGINEFDDGLPAYGAAGYMNLPDELNRICKEIYSNSEYGTARSMKIEDANTALRYEPNETEQYWYNGGWVKTENLTTKFKDLPVWNSIKDNGHMTPNGVNTEEELGNYEFNGYRYDVCDFETPITGREGNTIFGTSSQLFYWVASRGARVYNSEVYDSESIMFGGGEILSEGYVSLVQGSLLSSDGTEYGNDYLIRPVVSVTAEIPSLISKGETEWYSPRE